MNEEVLIPDDVKKELIVLDKQIFTLRVVNTETYLQAGEIFKAIGAMAKRINAFFEPLCKKADEAHKALTSAKAAELAKLAPLRDHVNKEQTAWNIEQEKVRKAEEDRLRQEALKAEEDRRLADALQAEKEGNKEEAIAILEEPAFVPPPIVESLTPKISGQAMVTTWRWRLIDINKLPRQYLQVNESAVNQVVRALKGKTVISGIEVYPEQSMRGVRQ